ncbi:hypothetical protein DLNHIDIE_00100 [Acidithiobacillus thiooxidans ATCC 19377]|uniref:Transcriptional regulator n=1 Tax=Acidithiobacillus thiooxidans ATCC 19377 TaxID=637390 RepID=A0A543Q1N3_ACITH|nr:hypothetical protein [Acidithiobacillus thiooxidans]MDX5935654.1 hypothetical protein [Acidithiobacillus thiooxidans]TQN50247.1 hypothetical protein DLNHIDIE_00100 [Acidithiobacillus thiooxidans ATCC 19377]
MNDDYLDFQHRAQRKALLIALHHGATISRSRNVKDAPFTVRVKNEQGIVPAGLVHELSQEGILRKQDYPHQFFYTLSARGAQVAREANNVTAWL